MKTKQQQLTLILLAATLISAGCNGYTHGFSMPPGAENVKTVAIEIFKNKTLYQDIEFEFTSALQNEICAKTHLTIAPRGEADAVITGAIESYHKEILRSSGTDEVRRYAVVLTVSYQFTRLPARGEPARVISSSDKIERSEEYEVMSNITETTTRARAIRRIAREVVSHIFEKW